MTDAPVPQIYLITPVLTGGSPFRTRLQAALSAVNVSCVLLRVENRDSHDTKKILQELVPIVQAHGAAALVEDPTLAPRVGADGVNVSLGGPDAADALQQALTSLKPKSIVGVGGLTTRHASMEAGQAGVDYVMFGDFAEPASSDQEGLRDLVAWWAEIFTLPCVAVCKREDDAEDLAAVGADFIAPGPWIWSDACDLASALSRFTARLKVVKCP